MAAWCVLHNTDYYPVLFGLSPGTGTNIDIQGDNNTASIILYNGSNLTFSIQPGLGRPFFAAFTNDGTTTRGFLRNWGSHLWGTVSGASPSLTPGELTIGNYLSTNTGYGSRASIWNLRVWRRVLTFREIAREFRAFKPVAPGVHSWWPLEGGPEHFVRDYSGNRHTLTRSGTGRAGRFFLPRWSWPTNTRGIAAAAGVPTLSAAEVTSITATTATPRVTLTF